tara:strand:- start:1406 stop:1654 length:249 start_codon:yes stop_codon:yes gene_type:complete
MKKMSNYCTVIDTTGLRCPLPVLKVRKNLPYLKQNQLALIIADDPLAEIDLRHFCDLKSYILENVSKNNADEKKYYEIKRKN